MTLALFLPYRYFTFVSQFATPDRGRLIEKLFAVNTKMSLTKSGPILKRNRSGSSGSQLHNPRTSKSGPAASVLLDRSLEASSSQKFLPVPRKNLYHLTSLVRKFSEFVFEFDQQHKLQSIWSSNRAMPQEIRRSLLGKSLQSVVGRDNARFVRTIFARISAINSGQTFQFSAVVNQAPRWFAVSFERLEGSAARSSRRSSRRPSRRPSAESAWMVLRAQDLTAQHNIEERLSQTELMLKHAEEVAEMGTWELDLKSRAVRWSKQLFRLYGLPPSKAPLGLEELWKTLHFKNVEKLRRDFEAAIRNGLPFRFSEPYTLPDGSVRILDGLAAPVTDSTGKIVRVVGVTRDITSHARTQADLRWLSHQLLTIRSEEQRRMGRELHETTAQTLAALKMTLAQIGRSVPRHNDRVRQLLRTSRELASAAVREVRFVSSFLHPPLLEETGLVVALDSYTKLFAERGGAQVDLQVSANFGRLEKSMELTIFRIVQETLNNVHRHARASTAAVRLERNSDSVSIEIKDDGIGIFHVIPEASARVPLGVGIAGIRERIAQMHGEFDISSAPGAGTTIRVSLPIHPTKEIDHEPTVDAKRERRTKTVSDSRRRRSRDRSPGDSLAARNGAGHRSLS
jgi:PAS domain S-box-containing protein